MQCTSVVARKIGGAAIITALLLCILSFCEKVLLFGRVLSGIAVAILSSAFETWSVGDVDTVPSLPVLLSALAMFNVF